MKPSKTTAVRITDALKRCIRGDTFDRCETECFYGRQCKHDCQARLLKDALGLIEAQQAEIAELRGRITDD